MTHTPYQWPGLSKPVYLPDWIVVEVKIIPKMSNWTSGIPSAQHVSTTWHDTGNPATNADGEYNWARNNRPGGSPASYNGVYDGRKVIITQRFDELVGHAANHTGNMTSYAFEQAFGTAGGGYEASLVVGAALHGGVQAARGWTTANAMKQHHFWSGKNCPGQIRNKGDWGRVVAMTDKARLAALDAAGAVRPAPSGPTYVEPVHIKALDFAALPPKLVTYDGSDFIYVNDGLKAIRETPRLAQAGGDDLRGGPVKAGETFVGEWLFKADDGKYYYITPTWHTRIRADDVDRIGDLGQPE